MYLVTTVDDNLNERHYLADSMEEGKKFLLTKQFEGNKEWMDECYAKEYEEVLREGAKKASVIANETLKRVQKAVGLLHE